MREPIRLSEFGVLRAQFLDEDLAPIQASGVFVNLYAPGLDPEVHLPTVSGLAPSYIGNGVYELTVSPPGPGGRWIDEWSGEILGTRTSRLLSFSLLDQGIIVNYPVFGLRPNTLVEVNLSSSISSIEGATLAADYSSHFSTEYSPLYSDVRKVKLAAGGFLGDIDDDTINLAILEASLEADVLSFKKEKNEKLYLHARREYVTCRAGMMLAENILANGGLLKSKLLGDFQVQYDTGALMSLLQRMCDKCAKWEAQLQTGGQARTVQGPRGVVKGELDPNRPAIGRGWAEIRPGELPIGNTRQRYVRRYYKTHKPRGGGGW